MNDRSNDLLEVLETSYDAGLNEARCAFALGAVVALSFEENSRQGEHTYAAPGELAEVANELLGLKKDDSDQEPAVEVRPAGEIASHDRVLLLACRFCTSVACVYQRRADLAEQVERAKEGLGKEIVTAVTLEQPSNCPLLPILYPPPPARVTFIGKKLS